MLARMHAAYVSRSSRGSCVHSFMPGLSREARRDALDRLGALGRRAEGRDAEIALAARPESGPRHADHVGLGQEPVEEVPGRQARRRADQRYGALRPP